MATTTLPFGYIEIVKGNGEEEINWMEGKISAKRIFWGPWADRFSFVNEYLTYLTDAKGQVINVEPTLRYPDIPIIIPLGVTIKGKLKASNEGALGMISFEKALIEVSYGIPPISTGGSTGGDHPPGPIAFQPYLIESGEVSVEYQTFKGPFFTTSIIGPDTIYTEITGLDEIQRVLPKQELTVTQLFVPEPDWIKLNQCNGRLNNETFYLPNGNFYEPGTALYYGYTYDLKTQYDGTRMFEFHHKFGVRDNPRWDQKLRKNVNTGFPELISLPTDPGIFNTIDLNQIFGITNNTSGL